jgi:hypothetical protein
MWLLQFYDFFPSYFGMEYNRPWSMAKRGSASYATDLFSSHKKRELATVMAQSYNGYKWI